MTDLIMRDELADLDFSDVDSGETIPPVSPGEVLRAEFMEPLGLSAHTLAKRAGVPTNRITGILHGTRTVTADTALRLAAQLKTSPEFWLNLQTAHDLELARKTFQDAA